MKKTSPEPGSFLDRIPSWARSKAHGPSPLSADSSHAPTLPLSNPQDTVTPRQPNSTSAANDDATNISPFPSDSNSLARQSRKATASSVVDNASAANLPPALLPQVDTEGAVMRPEKPKKKNVALRFWLTGKSVVLSSYINILLVFVPIGIAVKAANLSPGIIFGMNAIAIVPLAGLLSHVTESVAKRIGDIVGALMNVTFGNAVELIILYVDRPPTFLDLC